MIYQRTTIAILGVLALAFFAISGQAQRKTLLDKPVTTNFSKATMLQVISTLSNDFDVPIGLERTADYQEKLQERMSVIDGTIQWKDSNINVEAGTLKSVLDSLILQEPEYKWELRDGVINIFPTESRDEIVKQFLEIRIKRFAPTSTVDKFKIRDAILQLPEASEFLEKNHISPLFRYYSYRRGFRQVDDADLSVSDSTIREILNKVIRESEHKIWVIDRVGNRKESLSLDF